MPSDTSTLAGILLLVVAVVVVVAAVFLSDSGGAVSDSVSDAAGSGGGDVDIAAAKAAAAAPIAYTGSVVVDESARAPAPPPPAFVPTFGNQYEWWTRPTFAISKGAGNGCGMDCHRALCTGKGYKWCGDESSYVCQLVGTDCRTESMTAAQNVKFTEYQFAKKARESHGAVFNNVFSYTFPGMDAAFAGVQAWTPQADNANQGCGDVCQKNACIFDVSLDEAGKPVDNKAMAWCPASRVCLSSGGSCPGKDEVSVMTKSGIGAQPLFDQYFKPVENLEGGAPKMWISVADPGIPPESTVGLPSLRSVCEGVGRTFCGADNTNSYAGAYVCLAPSGFTCTNYIPNPELRKPAVAALEKLEEVVSKTRAAVARASLSAENNDLPDVIAAVRLYLEARKECDVADQAFVEAVAKVPALLNPGVLSARRSVLLESLVPLPAAARMSLITAFSKRRAYLGGGDWGPITRAGGPGPNVQVDNARYCCKGDDGDGFNCHDVTSRFQNRACYGSRCYMDRVGDIGGGLDDNCPGTDKRIFVNYRCSENHLKGAFRWDDEEDHIEIFCDTSLPWSEWCREMGCGSDIKALLTAY